MAQTIQGQVRKEWPPLHATVRGQGEVTAFTARGIPIVKPDGATLGHALEEGITVTIILPEPLPHATSV